MLRQRKHGEFLQSLYSTALCYLYLLKLLHPPPLSVTKFDRLMIVGLREGEG